MQSRSGNGRSRARGYGSSGYRKGGINPSNRNMRTNSSNNYSNQDGNENSTLKDNIQDLFQNKEVLERRRRKFEADAKVIERQKDSEYGLISRGEDMRLRDSSEARSKLFDTISQQMINSNNIKTDQILMSFRKLREGLLTVKPDEFTKKVLLSSVRFSISLQNYQSYIPCIHQLIEIDKKYNLLTNAESKEVLCYLVLHVSHFTKKLEDAFSILLRNFSINNSDSTSKISKIQELEDEDIVLLCLDSLATYNYFQWLKIYKFLKKSNESIVHENFIKLLNYKRTEIIKLITKTIGASYFLLGKTVLESLTNTEWNELVESHEIPWTLNQEQTTVIIRQRKSK